jgi:RHS repeat-associated protein
MSYDARNRCVSRTVNGTTTFLFYESWNLIEERDGSGTQTARYVHGARIDELITLTAQPSTLNQTYYYHHDALGSTTHLTDFTGFSVERYSYDTFGGPIIVASDNQPVTSSFACNRFLFTSRERLAELTIYDHRNRAYSPELGRFVQTDPLGVFPMNENLYAYVRNNPLIAKDPYGLLGGPDSKVVVPPSHEAPVGSGNYLGSDGNGWVDYFIDPLQSNRCDHGDCVIAHEVGHVTDANNRSEQEKEIIRNAARNLPRTTPVHLPPGLLTEGYAVANFELPCLQGKLALARSENNCFCITFLKQMIESRKAYAGL